MKTGYIKFRDIDTDKPIIEIKLVNGTVWMTVNEIADLLGVNIPTINKLVRRIFKEKFLRESEVTKEYRYTCPEHGECIRIYYNLEVILCLSYKIQSSFTKIFRNWVFHSLNRLTDANSLYNRLISCDSIIKGYSSLNLN